MDPFTQSLVATLIGTFLGAALALLSAFLIARIDEGRNDRRLLQSVIDRLHWSRALRPGQVGGHGQSTEVQSDRDRCTKSVISTRERIAAVSDSLSLRAKGLEEIAGMQRATLRYLSAVEQAPTEYVASLMLLRAALKDQVSALCAKNPKLTSREPGAGDLDNPLTAPRG